MKLVLAISSFFCAAVFLPSAGFAQAKIKFPVSISSKSLGYGPMFAAVKLGFMDRGGLEGQVVVLRGAGKTLSALMGGSGYGSASGTHAHIAAGGGGGELVLVGGTVHGFSA